MSSGPQSGVRNGQQCATSPTQWRAYCALVRWDWVREMKKKTTLISMGVMGLITLFLFSFAIPISSTKAEILEDTRAGILWVTFLFAATIGIDRAFRNDAESGLLEGLLLAPVERMTLYFARVTSTLLFVVTLQGFLFVLFLVLFNQSISGEGLLGLIVSAIATDVGFVTIGVLISAMTWSLPGGDVMLRILLFPMLLPILNVTVEIADRAFDGRAPTAQQLGMLFAVDALFLGAGSLLFEHLVNDSGGSS